MAKPKLKSLDEVVQLEAPALLDELVDSFRPKDTESRSRAMDLLGRFVDEILDPKTVVSPRLTQTINERIAAIDCLLSKQVAAIMHHPDFQTLEASWRGLSQLVSNTETGESMKIRVMPAAKKELLGDFQSATEFTESSMWKAVYDYEFGLYGGDPFGCLVSDYKFGKGAQDIELLTHISQVAAASHAPFLAGPAPDMFAMDSFEEMPNPRAIEKIFDKSNPQNTKWLSFRNTEESRFVGMCLPHVLGRLPYGDDNPAENFNFQEVVDGEDHSQYLWCSASFSFAERMTAAFAKHHWCVAITGPEGGGKVENLPVHIFKAQEGDIAAKCPTEIMIPDTRAGELSELGFIPLLHCKNTDYAAFFHAQSTNRPIKYDSAEATANADLSSQLQYLMCTSRIAHYLKAMCRDKIGSFMSRGNCEDFLNKWIKNYVLNQDNAPDDLKAKHPLREAEILVMDDKARPGCYKATAFLKPHFQLKEINVRLSLTAELPSAVK